MYDKQVSYRIQSTTTGHGCNIMQQQQSKTLVGTMEAVQRLILLILFLKVSAFRVESKENAAATSSSVDVDGNISQTKEEKSDRHVLIQGRYELLATYPHDSDAFTQGYTFFDGHIYEGTGLYGKSSLRKLDPENHSKSLQSFDIPEKYFGEGITHYKDGRGNDRILQITWRERTAFVYDAHSIELLFAFKYHVESSNGEGWGVTHNPNQNEFVVSDGSEYLFFWDVSSLDECELNLETSAKNDESSGPDDFKFCDVVVESKRQIKVHRYTSGTSAAIPIKYLNELEFIPRSTIDGTSTYSIFANVWYQNYLLEICPISGVVLKVYDLSRLCPEVINGEVLNGISVSEESDHVLYVTGKLWSHAHKIRLI